MIQKVEGHCSSESGKQQKYRRSLGVRKGDSPSHCGLHLQNITIEGASIVDGDNAATNGVIHIINKVQVHSPAQAASLLSFTLLDTLSLFHWGRVAGG